MTLKYITIGSSVNKYAYDDADFDTAIVADAPIKAGTPVDGNDVLRLEDILDIIADLVRGFSYNEIISTVSITIPVYQQMVVKDGIKLDGELIIDGDLALI